MLWAVWSVSLLTGCTGPAPEPHPVAPDYQSPYDTITPNPEVCAEQAVAFLSVYPTPDELLEKGDDDEASAWLWFHATYPEAGYLYFGDANSERLSHLHTAFWLRDVETGNIQDVLQLPEVVENALPALQAWYMAGGNLLLWSHAVILSQALGRLPEDSYTAPENDPMISCGPGHDDRGIWIMATQLYPAGAFKKDMSTHPIYRGLSIYTDQSFRGLAVSGPGWKEDHNCLFFNYPSRLTGRQWQQEICYTLLTDYYGIYPLGVWDSQVNWISQLNVFELRQGQTEYMGRIICVGNGGCEFSMRNPDGSANVSAYPCNNIYQDNILGMARNAIEYLRL